MGPFFLGHPVDLAKNGNCQWQMANLANIQVSTERLLQISLVRGGTLVLSKCFNWQLCDCDKHSKANAKQIKGTLINKI